MNLIPQALALLTQKEEEPGDVITSLLLAAKNNPELRQQLVFLLSAASVHRQSLINTALHQMERQGEPRSVRAAFALLASDEGAKTALNVLRSK